MAIETRTVHAVATLARIDLDRLDPARVQGMVEQLSRVIGWVEQLSSVDTSDIEPTAHPVDLAMRLRDDVAVPGPGADVILRNAPHSDGSSFLVPQVVEEDTDA